MGRFASTVALYEKFRPPYPPEFFRTVVEKLKLTPQHSLIDLGTGPALLALGFAPYVGRLTGVDPEGAMLAAAGESAKRAGRDVTLIQSKAEDLPQDIGRFDLVTIGRALHWMDHTKLPALFERLVAPHGAIAVCRASSARGDRNPWFETYEEVRRKWSDPKLLADPRHSDRAYRDLGTVLGGSAFHVTDKIRIETTHEVSVLDLVQRVLTFSPSSPDAVGDNVDAMLADVEAQLLPFARDGVVTEVVVSVADVARRQSQATGSSPSPGGKVRTPAGLTPIRARSAPPAIAASPRRH
jgi:SAM-dependent methyltransferase